LLAQQATSPLTVLLTSDLSRLEMRFLQAYGENASVNIIDLRELAAQDEGCAVINTAWGRDEAADDVHAAVPSMREQARRLRTHFPQAALDSSLRLLPPTAWSRRRALPRCRCGAGCWRGKAASPSWRRTAGPRAACAAAGACRVQAGRNRLDTFHHVRSVPSMRWLDALQSDFYYQDMLDLLKSPYMFADQPANERKQTVYQLEHCAHGAVAHPVLELAQNEAPELGSALARLRQAADELGKKTNTLHGWLLALERSLRILGVYEGLAADAAGEKLLQAVHTWQQELAADTTRFSRAEWRHWLAPQPMPSPGAIQHRQPGNDHPPRRHALAQI
jgi:hypothetical protein